MSVSSGALYGGGTSPMDSIRIRVGDEPLQRSPERDRVLVREQADVELDRTLPVG